MSGGSFNYLCHAWDVEDLFPKRHNLQEMADELARRGFPDAARETHAIWLDLRAFEVRTDVAMDRLRDVWKAVEWHQSCDWGPDSVDEAIAKYRGLAEIEQRREDGEAE